jgi:hypothetical protein
MSLSLWGAVSGIFLYSLLSAFEVFRCPILSQETKLYLITSCLMVPIFGPYLSNKKLCFKLTEEGRTDLLLELPFYITLCIPSGLKNSESSDDIE